MTSGIYLILCTANEAFYVGSSQNLRKRFCAHRYRLRRGTHDNTRMQNAWNKYGEAAFTFALLRESPTEDLLTAEQDYLDGCLSLPGCMNIARAATAPMAGRAHTPETRAKMSAAHKGKVPTIETRVRLSSWQRGRVHTPEARAKMSASQKGRRATSESIESNRRGQTGRVHTPETRAKMSESQKEYWRKRKTEEAAR